MARPIPCRRPASSRRRHAARPGTLLSLLLALPVLLAAGSCGKAPADPRERICQVAGVPLSEDLEGAVQRALRDFDRPEPDGPTVRDLVRYHELSAAIDRPGTRSEAADRLFILWRSQPTRLLWISLALANRHLLDREDDFRAMLALPVLADTATTAGAFLEAVRTIRYKPQGGLLRRAAGRADDLDPLDRIWLARWLARLDGDQGDGLAAVRRLLDQLPPARSLGGRRLESFLWYDLGRHLMAEDRLDDALHAAAMSVAMAVSVDDDYQDLRCRLLVGRILEARGDRQGARQWLDRIVAEAKRRDHPWWMAYALNLAAALAATQGDLEAALDYDRRLLRQSLAMADSLNVPRGLANVAYDFCQLGRPDSARVHLERARRWTEAFGDPENLAALPMHEARYECHVGNYARAESLLAGCRDMLPGSTPVAKEGYLLLEQLQMALEMGRPDLAYPAIGRLQQIGDDLRDGLPDQNLLADYEIATADLLGQQGEFRRAAAALRRARAAVARGGGEDKPWDYHRCAGELALLRDDYEGAAQEFAAALDLARRDGDPERVAAGRVHLAQALLESGRTGRAREMLTEAAGDSAFGGRYRTHLAARLFLAVAEAREGRHDRAVERLRRILDECGARTPGDLMVRLRLELGRSLAALSRPDEARGSLLEARRLLAGLGDRGPLPELASYHRRSRREILEALLDLDYGCGTAGRAADPPADRDLPAAALLLAEDLRLDRPSAGAPAPGRLCAALARDGRLPLVAYFVGEKASFRWVVTGDGVAWSRLPGRRDLETALAPVLADLRHPAREPDAAALGRLAALLLPADGSFWQPGTTLFLLSDGPLSGVPWSALPWPAPAVLAAAGSARDRAPALERGPICELPVLRTAAADRPARPPAALPLLAIGCDGTVQDPEGPDLPALRQAENEARAIAALWSESARRLVLGAEALGSEAWPDDLSRYGVVHVATHAVAYQGLPGRSTLRLAAPGGGRPLTLQGVADLDLDAELIYLSSCEADRRLSAAGSGLDSFARAFLAAGARAVVASTQRVDDEAAATLAAAFYRHWLAGASRAAALRAAQLEVRGDAGSRWHHPHFWAPYRLIGDGS